MLTGLAIKNFRSIEAADLKLGKITVIFGATSSGKSSVFYALLALRNFVLNPNQPADAFFNLGFQNLGGFDACVFGHDSSKRIGIYAEFENRSWYGTDFTKSEAHLRTGFPVIDFAMETHVAIPYALNQSRSFDYKEGIRTFNVHWNGFGSIVTPTLQVPDNELAARRLGHSLNSPVESLKKMDICPHRRGFFKPNYTAVPLSPTPTSEDEVASLIINDQHVAPSISIDTSEIFGRDFRTYTPPGTATTFFLTTELTGARVPSWLVNDGFGVNQIVYMLAKIHRPNVETILVEEPEVHLHPTIVRKFARVIARLAVENRKQIVFTTHSEQFLLSLLACVKEKLIAPEDLACYHVTRLRKQSQFTIEPVSDEGQISGGLSSFVEGELADIRTFLEASETA